MLKRLSPWFILCLIFAGCGREVASLPFQTYHLPVIEVAEEDIPTFYTTTGSVVSDERVDVSSRITGFIDKIAVREGERVKNGQLLVALDNSDVEGAIRRARATCAKACAALQDARTDVIRYENLFKSGCVSDNTLRKIRLQRDMTRGTLSEAQAALKTALAQRRYVRITSPVDGVVVTRQKRKGDLATPGVPILTVEATQSLLFETYVAELRLAHIHPGDKARVGIDALSRPLTGVVARVVHSGDMVTRRYLVKISLPETAGLLPGMFGRVHFQTGSERALIIPRVALVERGGLSGAFVLAEDGRARFRWLRIARQWPERLEITAGLRAGEAIIGVADARLRDGDRVIPQKQVING